LATGAYVGFVPVAPGTFGSLVALPLVVVLGRSAFSEPTVLLLIGGASAAAMLICDRAGSAYADVDSGRIVLDEICGMLVAGALIEPTIRNVALAFVLFRLLDVLKPYPANYFDQRMKNGAGVVADDLVAGLYTNLLVRALT
jgi:phosphatidylglycerophosphatase A